MDLQLTPLRDADIPACATLWHEGWQAGHAAVVPPELTRLRTRESFHNRLTRHRDHTWVARQGGRIAGFVILVEDEIYQFYVGQAVRGSGTASKLMDAAEARLRAAGVARAWLACSVGNARAARFYEKMGWIRTGTETMAFETSDGPFPLDIWRYEKDL